MLTLIGSKMAERVAASLLRAADMPELIVNSLEEYESQAVDLATNPERYRSIRQRLERGRLTSPLFDTRRWVQNLESGLKVRAERMRAVARCATHPVATDGVGPLRPGPAPG